jgi:menaquinone-dependent protoporphyrinogen oxidase
MEQPILVAYATKHGSTKEIAERIGKVLRDGGLPVEIIPVKQVASLEPFRAVVLGSASYYGFWRREAVKFLKKRAAELAARPAWLFMSGPGGKGDPVELLKGRVYPPGLQPTLDAIKPRDVAAFHGNTSPEKFSGWEKWVLRRVGSDAADFRDWDMITDWAKSIAAALGEAV